MHGLLFAVVCSFLILPACGAAPSSAAEQTLDLDDYASMRSRLVTSINEYVRVTADKTGVEKIDPAVIAAMSDIPRHEFVPEPLRKLAYLDIPLPLGHEQKISQPFLIALMTHLAQVESQDVVFETGTGAGYQAAILTRLAKWVYSVEVIAPLAEQASERLKRLGYDRVEIKNADGYYGWAEKGPFDAIIVKEAVHHIPPPLLNQLKPGGRMVAPVGPLDKAQMLKVITKDAEGRITQRDVLPVRFAPLQGGERI